MILRLTFYKLVELLTLFASHNCFAHCDGYIFIFDRCWTKIFFTQISLFIKVFNSKNLARSFSIHRSCSWLVIIINSQWYKEKLFVNYLSKKIQSIINFSHDQLITTALNVLSILKLISIIPRHYSSIEKMDMGVYVVNK